MRAEATRRHSSYSRCLENTPTKKNTKTKPMTAAYIDIAESPLKRQGISSHVTYQTRGFSDSISYYKCQMKVRQWGDCSWMRSEVERRTPNRVRLPRARRNSHIHTSQLGQHRERTTVHICGCDMGQGSCTGKFAGQKQPTARKSNLLDT